MNKDKAITIISTSLLIIIFGGFLVGSFLNMEQNRTAVARSEAKAKLQNSGYQIEEGHFVITGPFEVIDDLNFFEQHVPLGMVVYHKMGCPEGYVAVFNSTYSLAYLPEYKSLSWWIW